jgi:hypothetical protein
MAPVDRDTTAEARRLHAAELLDSLVLIAAAFIASEDPGREVDQRLTRDLVAVGRTAIARRMDQLRRDEPARWVAFDPDLIKDLVACATKAMVEAWSSAKAENSMVSTNPGTAPAVTKRAPSSH